MLAKRKSQNAETLEGALLIIRENPPSGIYLMERTQRIAQYGRMSQTEAKRHALWSVHDIAQTIVAQCEDLAALVAEEMRGTKSRTLSAEEESAIREALPQSPHIRQTLGNFFARLENLAALMVQSVPPTHKRARVASWRVYCAIREAHGEVVSNR